MCENATKIKNESLPTNRPYPTILTMQDVLYKRMTSSAKHAEMNYPNALHIFCYQRCDST